MACYFVTWTTSSEFGTYRLCEQRRFRRACASAQSRQNLRCSLIQAVSQEEPSDRKPDPWPLWMAGHAQLKLVVTECWRHKFAWRSSNNLHYLVLSDKLFALKGNSIIMFLSSFVTVQYFCNVSSFQSNKLHLPIMFLLSLENRKSIP